MLDTQPDDAPTAHRVLVISANPLARVGILSLLEQTPACEVVGDTPGEDDLAALVAALTPDVLVWDCAWDVALSIEMMQSLNTAELAPPILALVPDEQDAPSLLSAGVAAILPQDSTPTQLSSTLSAVRQGLLVLDPSFLPQPTLAMNADAMPNSLKEPLTPREHEVLQLLAAGLANKAIALQLGVSEHTVKFHVTAIMTKLEAQSRTEAVVLGMKFGLIIL